MTRWFFFLFKPFPLIGAVKTNEKRFDYCAGPVCWTCASARRVNSATAKRWRPTPMTAFVMGSPLTPNGAKWPRVSATPRLRFIHSITAATAAVHIHEVLCVNQSTVPLFYHFRVFLRFFFAILQGLFRLPCKSSTHSFCYSLKRFEIVEDSI